jgi:RNA polymerase sigma factor (sigma-70 family)
MKFQAFDAEYIRKLKAGDNATAEHFVGYFGQLVKLMAGRHWYPDQVEDIRQEVFVRTLRALKEQTIRRPEAFGAMVTQITRNVMYEYGRKESRHIPVDAEWDRIPDSRSSAEIDILAEQRAALVRDAIAALPEKDRALLEAAYFDDRAYETISAQFGVDTPYVRVLLHRARGKFRKIYLAAAVVMIGLFGRAEVTSLWSNQETPWRVVNCRLRKAGRRAKRLDEDFDGAYFPDEIPLVAPAGLTYERYLPAA